MIQPAWHLATSSLAGRRGRTALLVAAVAVATILAVAVAALMGTIGESLRHVIGRVSGLADARVVHRFQQRLNVSVIDTVQSWPGVAVVSPQLGTTLSLTLERTKQSVTATVRGVDPVADATLHPVNLLAGRYVERDGEVLVDKPLANKLGAKVGDKLAISRFGDPVTLTVVGICDRPALGILQKSSMIATLNQVRDLSGIRDEVDSIELQLVTRTEQAKFVESHAADLPPEAKLVTSTTSAAGLSRGMEASRLMLRLINGLVFLSAGFIILTSLTTSVTERMRELAILRCIGTSRGQIAGSQLLSGVLVAGLGALIGTPIGLGLAYALYRHFHVALESGFRPDPTAIAAAIGSALLCGLLGAAYPALMASRVTPLEALAARAKTPSRKGVLIALVIGLLFAAAPVVMVSLDLTPEQGFVAYTTAGLPLEFVGYFLLAVPLFVVVAWLLTPLLDFLLRLPRGLLRQSVTATPFRQGFTAGALMVSVALVISIWTGGRSLMNDWFDRIVMPDGFVHSYFPMSDVTYDALKKVPGVTKTCPTTLFAVNSPKTRFGPENLGSSGTLFVTFDPDAFFAMTDLEWVQGEKTEALKRLRGDRAVLVSKEYLMAHGKGVGSKLTLATLKGPQEFEIVGVVAATGLDVVVQFFGIQREYADAAISCVFGTNENAHKYFGINSKNLILLSFDPNVPDAQILARIKSDVPGTVAGSARVIRNVVHESSAKFMTVASTLSLVTLLIACFGVGNLLIAGIAARRFEFGVLRAIGSHRGMLARLVAAETILMAITGGLIGTALGYQLAWIGHVFHLRMLGLSYAVSLPWDIVAISCGVVLVTALLAALPAIVSLLRTKPRALLAYEG